MNTGQPAGERHYAAKLTAAQVQAIRAAKGVRQLDLAVRYGVNPSTVRDIRKGRTWRTVK